MAKPAPAGYDVSTIKAGFNPYKEFQRQILAEQQKRQKQQEQEQKDQQEFMKGLEDLDKYAWYRDNPNLQKRAEQLKGSAIKAWQNGVDPFDASNPEVYQAFESKKDELKELKLFSDYSKEQYGKYRQTVSGESADKFTQESRQATLEFYKQPLEDRYETAKKQGIPTLQKKPEKTDWYGDMMEELDPTTVGTVKEDGMYKLTNKTANSAANEIRVRQRIETLDDETKGEVLQFFMENKPEMFDKPAKNLEEAKQYAVDYVTNGVNLKADTKFKKTTENDSQFNLFGGAASDENPLGVANEEFNVPFTGKDNTYNGDATVTGFHTMHFPDEKEININAKDRYVVDEAKWEKNKSKITKFTPNTQTVMRVAENDMTIPLNKVEGIDKIIGGQITQRGEDIKIEKGQIIPDAIYQQLRDEASTEYSFTGQTFVQGIEELPGEKEVRMSIESTETKNMSKSEREEYIEKNPNIRTVYIPLGQVEGELNSIKGYSQFMNKYRSNPRYQRIGTMTGDPQQQGTEIEPIDWSD